MMVNCFAFLMFGYLYTDCNAMLFVQENCIIRKYNVPRLLYHVRHSDHSAFRALGIPALLTLGITASTRRFLKNDRSMAMI